MALAALVVLEVVLSEMSSADRQEVRCGKCHKSFWVEATDHRLPDGPFACGTCDLENWDQVAVFTGPSNLILVDGGGGGTLLDVLDSLEEERVRVIVLRRKRTVREVN